MTDKERQETLVSGRFENIYLPKSFIFDFETGKLFGRPCNIGASNPIKRPYIDLQDSSNSSTYQKNGGD